MKNFLPVIILLAGFLGCLGTEEEEVDEVPVTVELPAAFVSQSQIGKIVLTVRAADIPTPITAELTQPIPATPAFSVSIPPGSGREFEVIVTISSDSKSGFKGRVVTDVSTSGGTVPIDLRFVNFADDLISTEDPFDVLNSTTQYPDIDFVLLRQGSCTLSGITFPDAAILLVDFEDRFSLPSFVDSMEAYLEFDTDGNPATPSGGTTKISRIRGGVAANFSTGAENYVQITLFKPGGPTPTIRLFNSLDDSVIDVLSSSNSGAKLTEPPDQVGLTLCIDRNVFNTSIDKDGDGKGTFNLLVGRIEAGAFSPNDIAYRSGVILYDFGFDTSSL
jgi:hypothetical protein